MSLIFGTKNSRAYTAMVIDCILHFFALSIASLLRNKVLFLFVGSINQEIYISVAFVSIILYIMIYISQINDTQDEALQGNFYALVQIVKRVVLMILLLMVFLFVTKQGHEVSRIVLITFGVICIVFDFLSRIFLRTIFKKAVKNGWGSDRILLVTLYDNAESVIEELLYASMKNVIGVVLLDDNKGSTSIVGIPIIGDRVTLLDTVKEYVYDEVFMHIPYELEFPLESVILGFEQMGIPVNLNVDVFGLKVENKEIGVFGNYHVITFSDKSRKLFLQLVKRLMDIFGAIVGLVLTAVIYIIFAPAIKLSSKGPIFFSQTRVGMNGRRFRIYKFRTMVDNAEDLKKSLMSKNEMDGFMFKMKNDPRVTKVGRFMRKTNLDEFPQFLNVLLGDMSLVGTRPPTEDEYHKYENNHLRRLSIKPGITGLWQVSGRNNIKSFDDVVKLDLSYIDNWSILLDIKIMFQTIGQMFTGNPDPKSACNILGVNVSSVDMKTAIRMTETNLSKWKGKYICAANVHTTIMSYENPDYLNVQNGAVMVLPDGKPLSNVARKRGCTSIGRVSGPDYMTEIFKLSEKKGYTHFFYGSSEEVLGLLKERLITRYPHLQIVGMISPPYRELLENEDEEYVRQINDANPDFVWIGLGAPKQEIYMAKHEDMINGLMVGVGAGFDFHAGTEKRAPVWMRNMSLEWLYRLMQNPKRLFKRYMSTNWKFIRLVHKENKNRKG